MQRRTQKLNSAMWFFPCEQLAQLFLIVYVFEFFKKKTWLPRALVRQYIFQSSFYNKKLSFSFSFGHITVSINREWNANAHTEANARWCSCQLSACGVTYLYRYSIKLRACLVVKFWTSSRFILKQLDYSLSISMCDSWFGLRPHQLLHDRNLELII